MATTEAMIRRRSRPVRVGDLEMGGDAPLRVQSMTTTPTQDIPKTIRQTADLARAGCDLVRITAQTTVEAAALGAIQAGLRAEGIRVPLAADIHFNPKAALEAAEHVEKVRVNPGNFADSKRFAQREYTDDEYRAELDRIRASFAPLVEKCKALHRAIRIGTNHGSLSDRVMNRYGDTAAGMVESALEYLRVAESLGFGEIVFSMKASNPVVMLHANRLLVRALDQEQHKIPYPLHLGVTEAGEGQDARLKSALGIGVLLAEGIGDTIRVSLTEDPVREVPVARSLAEWAAERWSSGRQVAEALHPFQWARRISTPALHGTIPIGGEEPVKVGLARVDYPHPRQAGAKGSATTRLGAVAGARGSATTRLGAVAGGRDTPCEFVLETAPERGASLSPDGKFHLLQADELLDEGRRLARRLEEAGDRRPLVLVWDARRFQSEDIRFLIEAAVQVGGLLVDGIGDAVVIRSRFPADRMLRLAYDILQAARVRSVKTEYIACPGCGRTLFDLEPVTQKIKARTSHLKGVKIAIMGCIVNGPGEMADADFGYVGGSPGTVNLYVGKEMVERGIPSEAAPDRLIELIQAHGKWADP